MKTRLSSKGQIVLPKPLRERHGWREGTEIEVEELREGVMLHFAPSPAESSLDELLGCAGYRGPRVSQARMDAAIARAARASARRSAKR